MTYPPTQLLPFPEPGPHLADLFDKLDIIQLGGRAANEILGTGEELPHPWDPATITDPTLQAEVWQWLGEFVIWYNHEHTWYSQDQIPACWLLHPHLTREIATIADQRRLAAQAPTSTPLADWHHHALPAFTERTQPTRTGCETRHTPWPGRAAHQRHVGLEG